MQHTSTPPHTTRSAAPAPPPPETPTSLEWQVLEFELPPQYSRIPKFFIIACIGLTAYAVISNNPIMAFTFVLFATVIFLRTRKQPEIVSCSITASGIRFGKDLYDFENIRSFWIIYEPAEQRILLETNGSLVPSLSLPLGNVKPTAVRNLLLKYLPEKKMDPGMIDIIGRFLHI